VAEPVHANIGGVSAETAVPRKDAHEHLIYKRLEVKVDTSFLMHGNLMHTRAANQSGKSRVAFNFGNVERTREWLIDNYL
jgi:ectoine hydroxylase-related dioxygenase (phytanoyl-CoA dioxygenase family)